MFALAFTLLMALLQCFWYFQALKHRLLKPKPRVSHNIFQCNWGQSRLHIHPNLFRRLTTSSAPNVLWKAKSTRTSPLTAFNHLVFVLNNIAENIVLLAVLQGTLFGKLLNSTSPICRLFLWLIKSTILT